jgi:hypothetical protein
MERLAKESGSRKELDLAALVQSWDEVIGGGKSGKWDEERSRRSFEKVMEKRQSQARRRTWVGYLARTAGAVAAMAGTYEWFVH